MALWTAEHTLLSTAEVYMDSLIVCHTLSVMANSLVETVENLFGAEIMNWNSKRKNIKNLPNMSSNRCRENWWPKTAKMIYLYFQLNIFRWQDSAVHCLGLEILKLQLLSRCCFCICCHWNAKCKKWLTNSSLNTVSPPSTITNTVLLK